MEGVKRTVDCATDLKPRFEQLVAERQGTVEAVWDEIDRYVDPLGSSRTQSKSTQESGVEWRRGEVWDGTAIVASEKMAAFLNGAIVPSTSQWLRLGFGNVELAKSVEAQAYLDEITDLLWAALQASDFQKEIGTCFSDIVRPGTTAISVEPVDPDVWRGLNFEAWPVREFYFEEGPQGELVRAYRRLAWTPVAILRKFHEQMEEYGEEIIPERIRKAAQQPDGGSAKLDIVYCIFPRPEEKRRRLAEDDLRRTVRSMKRRAAMTGQKYEGMEEPEERPEIPPTEREFGCVYFDMTTGEPIGVEGGYYEMPASVARFARTAASRWGHSPTMAAMPTIKYLNAYLEAVMTASEKAIDPPMMTTLRGILGDLDQRPGAVNVVDDIANVAPLHAPPNLGLVFQFVQDLRAQIASYYRLEELDLKKSPQMSATEAQIRDDRMMMSIGPMGGGIQDDLITPIVQISLGIMARQGQLPPKPPVLDEWEARTGKPVELSIEYLGPFARAQRVDQVAGIERLASFAAGLLKMGFNEAALVFDPIKSLREVAKRLGAPAECLNSENEVAQAKREAREAQKAMAEAEIAKTQAQAMQAGAAAQTDLAGLPVPAAPAPIVGPPLEGY